MKIKDFTLAFKILSGGNVPAGELRIQYSRPCLQGFKRLSLPIFL